MAILDFSVSGWHGFGSVTQVCFGISVSNFVCMSFVAVGRSLTNVSYVAFKMAALWFWTMLNFNPPIAHCHPLLWGGGILVDHWSTISSSDWVSKTSSILKIECCHLCISPYQVMSCCLICTKRPRHYCAWLIISEVLCINLTSHTENAKILITKTDL